MLKSVKWLDTLAFGLALGVIIVSAFWVFRSGNLFQGLVQDEKLSWHLIRSIGLCAYLLLAISMIWGLFVSTQFVKDWSPGALSMSLHSAVSWLALILGFLHALLLMWDKYFSYSLKDILVPFSGPYRPIAVGLGTLACWGMVLVALSFPFKKRLGHRLWKTIHLLSYLTFGMVTVHALAAGTDSERLGFRILVGVSVTLVILLLGIRLGKDRSTAKPTRKEKVVGHPTR